MPHIALSEVTTIKLKGFNAGSNLVIFKIVRYHERSISIKTGAEGNKSITDAQMNASRGSLGA